MNSEPLNLKLVIVGDGSVGKTCILVSYTTDKFPTEYIPTCFDNFTTQLQIDNQMVSLSLWDTAGQETYNMLRTLSYSQTDIFLVVFDVTEPDTFTNALEKWIPELSLDHLNKVPKILVGNKIDMRSMDQHIQKETGEEMARRKGCQYIECSALTTVGLKQLFEEAARAGIKYNQESMLISQPPLKEHNQQIHKEQRRCFNCNIM